MWPKHTHDIFFFLSVTFTLANLVDVTMQYN